MKMDIIRIFLDADFNIGIIIHKYLWLILLAFIVIWVCLKSRPINWNVVKRPYEIDETTIGIGNNVITLKPNYKDLQIAYALWVELSTRKIGLPLDFENDVIVEVLDSWYEFFRITRELLKQVPISRVHANKETRTMVNIAIEVLNQGMRPFLTKWQARFRKWYLEELEKDENKALSPQEIQRKYPQYDALVREMQVVNQNMINYRKLLKELSFGKT